MFRFTLLKATFLGLLATATAAPAPEQTHEHKHGQLITTYDDKLLSILPAGWNKSTPITYVSCAEMLKSVDGMPDYCLKSLPIQLQTSTNFTASPSSDSLLAKRDSWVGPLRDPWHQTCTWQANAEYGLASQPAGEWVYWDIDFVQLVNYNNNNEVWAAWSLNDAVRDNQNWNWFNFQDARSILYVTYKTGAEGYEFRTATFQIHEKGYTWRNMKNGERCWNNRWTTFWGIRTLYQCYFPCQELLW